jgi:hypothetical protein
MIVVDTCEIVKSVGPSGGMVIELYGIIAGVLVKAITDVPVIFLKVTIVPIYVGPGAGSVIV